MHLRKENESIELVKSLYENNRSMGDHKIDGRPFFMHKVPNVLQPHPPLTFLLPAKNLCHFLIGFCIGGIV